MSDLAKLFSIIMFSLCVGCSSGSSEVEEKQASCEQVKEFEEAYKACLDEANKNN